MKYFFTFLITLIIVRSSNAQIVNIPDVNFKNYLVTNFSVNTNNDGEIQTTEANAFAGMLFADSKNITDLTGIESFINITELRCQSNNISSLDVSNCSNLIGLLCGGNPLTSLNVSGCTSLESLYANFSPLTSVNLLTNTALTSLYVQNNQLTTLDLSGNPSLIVLNAANNQITTLNITNNTELNNIQISNNLITSLDFSNHSDLNILWVDSNNLSTLNIQNDSNVVLGFFKSLGNPNLSCIQVDDVAYANANFTDVDATSTFSTNCTLGVNDLDNSNITNIYPNPVANTFNIEVTANNLSFRIVSITGKIIKQAHLFNGKNSINVTNLPNGFYSLCVYNAQGVVATKKLIVAH